MTLREFIEMLEEIEVDENAAAYEVVAYSEDKRTPWAYLAQASREKTRLHARAKLWSKAK